MRPVENGLTIEPGKTVKLAPGGYHLMMTDLMKQPLKRGDKVPVTLEFEKAGKVTVSLDVEGVGAQGPAGGSSTGGKFLFRDATCRGPVRSTAGARQKSRRSPCIRHRCG